MADGTPARGDDQGRRFQEAWPLHAVRYGAVLAGLASWLWEPRETRETVLIASLFSLFLIAELPLHAPRSGRLRPLWAVVQCAAALLVAVIRPGAATAPVLCAAIGGIAAEFPRAWALAAFGSGASAVLAGHLLAGGEPGARSAIAGLAATAAAAWVGRQFALRMEQAEAHRRTVEELERAQERIARLAETSRELAAAEERRRVLEELHDTLGHALVGTLLQVQVAERFVEADPARAKEQLAAVERSLRATLDRVRQALRANAKGRGRLGIGEALRQLAGDFEAAGGPAVTLSMKPGPESVSDVAPEVADVLYRAAQEALTNAVRHGKAKRVRVELEATGRRIVLRVADDGIGAGEYSPGMGLSGMVSRVQAVGGTIRFQTAPGKGFCVEVGVRRR